MVKRVVVPPKDSDGTPLRQKLLRECHEGETMGHSGITKTLQRLRQYVYWEGMAQDVIRWVNDCESCQRIRAPPRHGNIPLMPIRIGRPFDKVAIDIIGPVTESEIGNRYILTLVDYATRWAEAYPMRNVTADLVVDLIVDRFIPQYGIMGTLLSDRGAQFMSHILGCLARRMNIKLVHTSAYRPSANGAVERFNGTLVKLLTKWVLKGSSDRWDLYLPWAVFA